MLRTMDLSTKENELDRGSKNIETKASDMREDMTNRGLKGFSLGPILKLMYTCNVFD